jgi:hypothetical protein
MKAWRWSAVEVTLEALYPKRRFFTETQSELWYRSLGEAVKNTPEKDLDHLWYELIFKVN